MSGDAGHDTLRAGLFDTDVMNAVWTEEQKHIQCIQDPDLTVVQLYTETGYVTKGGVQLKTYHCGTGSMSLESFHRHLV